MDVFKTLVLTNFDPNHDEFGEQHTKAIAEARLVIGVDDRRKPRGDAPGLSMLWQASCAQASQTAMFETERTRRSDGTNTAGMGGDRTPPTGGSRRRHGLEQSRSL